jgi:hypothetical protein
MKRILTALSLAGLISVIGCGSAWAQATAQISGSVQDSSGAVLPGAEITATQTETGISRMTLTNETGSYVLPNLPLGPYKIEAGLPGFRTFVQTGIVLQVNSNPTINVVLQVGQVSEQVEVQANAALVDTRNLSVGQVMETERIMDLPLNGRNAQELVLLGGGAVQLTPEGGNNGGITFPGRLQITSAGSLGTSTEYTLDGIRHIDASDSFPMPIPFPDALAEFKTEIGGLSASQARGAQVSIVTKSGTNAFHGDLFEFVRNDLFNARSYFAIAGSTLKRNQFGGTVGGPVIKNKLFFFGGYQGTTLRQDPSDTRSFVPTAAMLAGDFTAFTSPLCNAGRQITLKAPFVNNRINPALFSPAAVQIALRLPKTDSACGEVHYPSKTSNNQGQYVSKVDYQASAKHSLFWRYLYSKFDTTNPFQFTPDNPLNAKSSTPAGSHAFTFGSTYLISANTVNAFRLSFTKNRKLDLPVQYFGPEDVGMNVFTGVTPHQINITVSSGFTLGSTSDDYGDQLYQVADDVSMTRGRHQFGFGSRVAEARSIQRSNAGVPPSFTISSAVTGAGLADFLTGNVSSLTQSLPPLAYSSENYVSFYGQDTWQLKPRLSMSYGLRWQPIFPIVDHHRPVGQVDSFDFTRYQQGIRSAVFVNAPPGITFPGDPGFALKNNGSDSHDPKVNVWNTYWKDFAPRIGLAWDVQGNGRTSVRASYGIAYEEYGTLYRLGSQTSQPPWASATTVLSPAGGLDDPWRGVPGGNPFPLQVSKNMPFVPFGQYMPSNPNLSPTYSQSWNLSLQREVVPGTLVSVSYQGTGIIHLQTSSPLNEAIFVPGVGNTSGNCFLNGQITPFKVNPGSACSTTANTQDRRSLSFVNPAVSNEIGRMATIVNGGTQSYNGMLASVQRRFSRGLSLNANYTLSHCIGDYIGRSSNGAGPSVDVTYQDPNNRRKDRGNCEADQRHNFNLTALGETPKFANRTLSLLGTGWRLSGIYRAGSGGTLQTGDRPTVGIRTVVLATPPSGPSALSTPGVDACLCDISNQRPNLVLPNAVYPNKSGRPGTQWLNPAAFAMPALGTLGNLGRVTLQMPLSWQFDTALSRVFNVRESQRVEVRFEAFNIMNSFRPGVISTTLTDANFGKIRTALDPRVMQFALKYLF